jgi:transcriptional regulator with XRE-family HTH domain
VSGFTKWSEIRDREYATDEDRDRLAAARAELDAELALHARTLGELRRARALTQTQLARSLAVSQAQVSRIESQADVYLSTLRSYVEAMGGELALRVTFEDGAWAEVTLGELFEEPDEDATLVVVENVANGVYAVRPHPKGWSVTRQGRTRPAAVLTTKEEAVARARALLERSGGEVTVRRSGTA